MERTIDRTSYRRNARNHVEREKKKENNFSFLEVILNQIIISLLIISAVLAATYFEVTEIEEWIVSNMSKGYTMTEVVKNIKENLKKKYENKNIIFVSGEGKQVENLSIENESGENIEISGDVAFKTAVEGINQMTEDANFLKNNYKFKIPLNGVVTSIFGCRDSKNKIVSSYHSGLDIAANAGTNIVAAHSGVVILAKDYSTYGKCVMIENEELVTLYAHCLSINVKEGQKVEMGDCIAKVGMTRKCYRPTFTF